MQQQQSSWISCLKWRYLAEPSELCTEKTLTVETSICVEYRYIFCNKQAVVIKAISD